ncbi:MAG: phosphoenolpyruvate-protein phosphotransferase [Candidatus Tyloplasma litorale]|nr:MAG: phosphoenolpyruvate-protein phosphotransferase [Mycoplasmatales bacterium]
MNELKGIGASNGISKGKAYILKDNMPEIKEKKIKDAKKEIKKFEDALEISSKQISLLKEGAIEKLGQEKAMVFDAHLGILLDPEMDSQVKSKIESEKVNASFAVMTVAETFKQMFLSMEDDYMKERAADVSDVTTRIIKNIEGIEIKDLTLIDEEVIIIAHDLTPSETSQLNAKFVKGFVTEIGGRTSHSAIMARSLEIPAVVGTGSDIFNIKENSNLLIDGSTGEILINPSEKLITKFNKKAIELEEKKKIEATFKDKESISKDGWKTKVAANIGSPADIDAVLKNGSDGVGLFRTEFLYMDAENWPTEDEQFEAYKKVLESVDHKIVIRTLDIGGDKKLNYYKFPYEMNPFLGYRAIRLQLDKLDIFDTQIRALLRASVYGKLAVNIPMIATIDEFKAVKERFAKIAKELKSEKIKIGEYELGIMVEVPSVVEMADKFAKHADFFSVGTNDLIQYTFAADRMSEYVSYLYQPFNPAILRKLKTIIDASHKEGKWTAICGEMAGDPLLAPVLVGMGLDEFSMSATSILEIRRLISEINKEEAQKLVDKVLDVETDTEVKALIQKFLDDNKITI